MAERIVLEYDPSDAIAGAAKANKAIESTEKTAERAGTAISKTATSVGKAISSSAQNAVTATERFIEGAQRKLQHYSEALAGTLIATKAALAALAGFAAHDAAVERLAIGYKALRLAMAPSLFSAVVIGAGIATQATVKLTLAEADLASMQAQQSVILRESFSEYRLLTISLQKLGLETSQYASELRH